MSGDLLLFVDPYTSMKVFISTDDGYSWSQRYDFQTPVVGDIMLVENTILIGTQQFGVHRSDDLGQSFLLKNAGITDGTMPESVSITRSIDNILYRLTQNKVYYSTDKGDNWVDITHNLKSPLYGKVMCNSAGELLLFSTLDSKTYFFEATKKNWKIVSNTFPSFRSIARGCVSTSSAIFYIDQDAGIQKGSKNGTNWETSNTGIIFSHFTGLVSIGNGKVLVAHGGISALTPEGWQTKNHTTNGDLIVAGKLYKLKNGRIYSTFNAYSDNQGHSWSHTWVEHIRYLTTVADSAGNLFSYGDPNVGSPRLYRSSDSGNGWELVAINNLPDFAYAYLSASGNKIYAAGFNKNSKAYEFYEIDYVRLQVVLRSTLSDPIAEIEAKDGSIYLRTPSSLLRSDDRGVSWKTLYLQTDPITGITVSPYFCVTGKVLWIGGLYGEIKYSLDKGETWQDISLQSNFLNLRASNFVVDQTGIVYATIDNLGLIKSSSSIIDPQFLDPDPIIPVVTHIEENILSIFPNPCSGTLTVNLENNQISNVVEFSIISIYGQELKRAYSTFTENEIIDLSDQQPGSYILRLRGAKVSTERLIIKK